MTISVKVNVQLLPGSIVRIFAVNPYTVRKLYEQDIVCEKAERAIRDCKRAIRNNGFSASRTINVC